MLQQARHKWLLAFKNWMSAKHKSRPGASTDNSQSAVEKKNQRRYEQEVEFNTHKTAKARQHRI